MGFIIVIVEAIFIDVFHHAKEVIAEGIGHITHFIKKKGEALIKKMDKNLTRIVEEVSMEVIALFFFYLFWISQMHPLILTKMVLEISTDRVSALDIHPSGYSICLFKIEFSSCSSSTRKTITCIFL